MRHILNEGERIMDKSVFWTIAFTVVPALVMVYLVFAASSRKKD